MYYEKATILPSEALVERFYSLARFVYDNRRYNLDDRNITCVRYYEACGNSKRTIIVLEYYVVVSVYHGRCKQRDC